MRWIPVALVITITVGLLILEAVKHGALALIPDRFFWGGSGVWGIISAVAGASKLDPPWLWLVWGLAWLSREWQRAAMAAAAALLVGSVVVIAVLPPGS
jgi:hypothetical protein